MKTKVIKVKDLVPGNIVLSIDGKMASVVKITPFSKISDAIIITLNEGSFSIELSDSDIIIVDAYASVGLML